MKLKTCLMLLICILCIVTLSAAPETGKRCADGKDNDGDGLIDSLDPDCGGGTGNGNTTYPVTFEFDDTFDGPSIESDDGRIYEDGVDSVRAEFVPAGNPILSLRSKRIKRDLWIDYGNCLDLEDNLLTDGDPGGIRENAYVSHVGGVFTNLGEKIADNVLLMEIGQSGFTEMDTTYSPPTGGREGFSIRFGGEPDSENIKITRNSQTRWTVENIAGSDDVSTAAVGTVRNGSFTPKGLCDINVQMTINCDTCP